MSAGDRRGPGTARTKFCSALTQEGEKALPQPGLPLSRGSSEIPQLPGPDSNQLPACLMAGTTGTIRYGFTGELIYGGMSALWL